METELTQHMQLTQPNVDGSKLKQLSYKSYSGGRWTWPTPLKSPESKSKSPSPTRRLELKLHEVPTTDSSQVRRVQVQVHRGEAEVYLNLDGAYLS